MRELDVDVLKELAPDRKSFGNSKKLAKADKWDSLGQEEKLIWGTATGSSGDTYYVYVEAGAGEELSFECSCPSRKRPCKHSVGIAILHAGDPAAIPQAAMPSNHRWDAQERYQSSWE